MAQIFPEITKYNQTERQFSSNLLNSYAIKREVMVCGMGYMICGVKMI
jgi:hypothetical protein